MSIKANRICTRVQLNSIMNRARARVHSANVLTVPTEKKRGIKKIRSRAINIMIILYKQATIGQKKCSSISKKTNDMELYKHLTVETHERGHSRADYNIITSDFTFSRDN